MTPTRLLGAAALTLALAGQAWAAPARLDDGRMFASGEDAFAKVCARCHTGREDAVGPDLRAGEYDADIIRFFARHGSGPMPAFTESMVADATLDEIAAYLAAEHQGTGQ